MRSETYSQRLKSGEQKELIMGCIPVFRPYNMASANDVDHILSSMSQSVLQWRITTIVTPAVSR
jgi:hypothetical protein